MSEQTPLDKLGDAVRTFMTETDSLSEGAFVTGWVLAVSHVRIQTDDDTSLPLVTGAQYALSPEVSVVQAAGLAKFLEIAMEKATWEMLNTDDE